MSLTAITRPQSRNEEIANSISHGLGLVAAIVGSPFLLVHAARFGDAASIVGASIFAATMLMLYLGSTLYHTLPAGNAKHVFRVIEHAAIFLLIAGTYTPFYTGCAAGRVGLDLVWAGVGAGRSGHCDENLQPDFPSRHLHRPYLLMGWLIVIAAEPLSARVPASGTLWLVAGGLAYTIGVGFFAFDARLRYGHFIWHLFVMMGTGFHYFAVLGYAI